MSEDKNPFLRNFDWSILLILLGLAFFSYMGISGSDKPFLANRQLLYYGVGFVALVIMMFIDFRYLNQFSYVFYGVGLVLLVGLFIIAEATRETLSWYSIGGYFNLQPAEFMKLFVILSVSSWFAKMKEKQIELEKFYQLWPFFLLFGVPFMLIVLQPDLGNALVLSGVFFSMIIVTGVRLRHITYIGGIIAAGIGILTYIYFAHNTLFFKIIKEYQWLRLTAFISDDVNTQVEGYQLFRSLIAIGSGTLQGKGVDADTLVKNNWVPVSESDFIFSVIGETFGFIGSSTLILLFFLLIYRLIRVAMTTDDLFASYVISGIIGMFVFQIFENIGMTIGIMPITGITLPFVSFGGSSLLTNMAAVGIVLGIGMRRRKLMF